MTTLAKPVDSGRSALPAVSVVVAAFADERWPQTMRAIESVRSQSYPPSEVVLVIDHNPSLYAAALAEFRDLLVIENEHARGASGARNSGIEVSSAELVAFLDDDAVADRDWLARSVPHFASPAVVGVGGKITPLWEGTRPAWFPEEILWAVGATYRGMPSDAARVRNVWAGNMLVRRTVCEAVGGFRVDFGKRGDREDFQAEDTEFCLRTARAIPGTDARWLFEPRAIAAHHVPVRRSTWTFLVARCYHEGRNKVIMSQLVGSDITGRERTYVLRTLPLGMLRGLADVIRGDVSGAARFATIGCCTVAGVLGAVVGKMRNRQASGTTHDPDSSGEEVRPILVCEVDLAEPLDVLLSRVLGNLDRYAGAHVLVRFASEPLGVVEFQGQPDPESIVTTLWADYGAAVRSRMGVIGLDAPRALPADGIRLTADERRKLPWIRGRQEALAEAPSISVVICTRDPDNGLEVTLHAAASLDYPSYEIVLVDNASTSEAAKKLVESRDWEVPVRLIVEPKPGLSRARNTGARVATGDLLAFLDDDETPDRYWLSEYARAFRQVPEAAAASGLILPRSLETAAQRFFEGLGGHSKGRGFERLVFDPASHATQHPLYPMPPFGAGGNMCFRRDVLRAIGGFDESLGAGTVARGGEDTAAFADVMLAGFTTLWQPSAFVRHDHYDSFEGAAGQLRGYGVGLTAFYTRMLTQDPRRVAALARLAMRAMADVSAPGRTLIGSHARTAPFSLRRAQWTGLVEGPVAYLRSKASVGHQRRGAG